MLAHLNELENASAYIIPWIATLIGLGASLHCVAMCGGLVSSCANKKSNIASYQVGRLLGYLLLSIVAGAVGTVFKIQSIHPILGYIPGLLIGLFLLYWGVRSYKVEREEVKLPGVFNQSISKAWGKAFKINSMSLRSFLIGGLSIFLPCGVLYGVLIVTITFQSIPLGMLAIFFFWMGTLPAMAIAPDLTRRIFLPIYRKYPRASSGLLITIGIITVSYRLMGLYGQATCH